MKNKRAIFFLFCANSVSGVSQGISMIAIPWYFAGELNMPSFFGALYATITGLSLFWGLLVGTMVDRFNRKYIFLFVTGVGALLLSAISFSGYYMGTVHYLLVAAAFASTYFIYSVHYPNLYAFAQEITEKKHYGRITSYIEIQGQLTTMIAGGLAALLLSGVNSDVVSFFGWEFTFPFTIEKWELHEIFAVDAITYLLAFALILLIRYVPIEERIIDTGSIKDRLIFGINYLKSNKYVFLFGIASFSVFVTILCIGFFIAPIYINNHLHGGAGVYAISDVFFACGAVLAGFGIRYVFKQKTVVAIIVMSLVTACIYFFYTVNYNFSLFYVTMLLIGCCNAGIRIMRMTYIFNHIPNNIIGRTNSIFGMSNVMLRFTFLTSFSLPFFASGNNIIYPFMIMGCFIVVSTIPLLVWYKKILKS